MVYFQGRFYLASRNPGVISSNSHWTFHASWGGGLCIRVCWGAALALLHDSLGHPGPVVCLVLCLWMAIQVQLTPPILTQVWLWYELFSSRHLSGSVWMLGLRVDFNCASCFKSPKILEYLFFLLVLKIAKDFLEHTHIYTKTQT